MSSINPNSATDILPNEVWENVLLYLPSENQATTRRVCRDFQNIISCERLFSEVAKNKKRVPKAALIRKNIKQLKYESKLLAAPGAMLLVKNTIKTDKWECLIDGGGADFITFKNADARVLKTIFPNMGKISSIALLANQLFVCCKGRILIYDISFDKNDHIVVDYSKTISSFKNCVEIKMKNSGTLRCIEKNGKKYDLKFSAKSAKTDPKNEIFKNPHMRVLRLIFDSSISSIKGYALEVKNLFTNHTFEVLKVAGKIIGGIAVMIVSTVALSALLSSSIALFLNPQIWLICAKVIALCALIYAAIIATIVSIVLIGVHFINEAINHKL